MKTVVLDAPFAAPSRPIELMVSSLRVRPWLSRATVAVLDRWMCVPSAKVCVNVRETWAEYGAPVTSLPANPNSPRMKAKSPGGGPGCRGSWANAQTPASASNTIERELNIFSLLIVQIIESTEPLGPAHPGPKGHPLPPDRRSHPRRAAHP